MVTTDTGAANITHTLLLAMRETCWLVCKSDNLQIPSSQESSGSVQRSLSVDISQDYSTVQGVTVVKSENVTQGDNNNGTM